jgi:F0F1-type ATP synthase membrane subunit b/b'
VRIVRRRRLLVGLLLVSLTGWSAWALAEKPHVPRLPKPPPPPPPSASAPTELRPARPLPHTLPPVAPPPPAKREVRHEQAEEAESEQPAPINWVEFGTATPPYIAMVINFGIVAAAYYLLGKKPVAAALQNRRDTIAKDIDEAHKMLGEAQARAQTYQAKLERLGEEVLTARTALVHAGQAERDRIVSEAEAKAERMRKDADFQVEQELKQIHQDLWRETVEAAVVAAEELLKKRVTPADQERMAEDYLAELMGKTIATVDVAVPQATS